MEQQGNNSGNGSMNTPARGTKAYAVKHYQAMADEARKIAPEAEAAGIAAYAPEIRHELERFARQPSDLSAYRPKRYSANWYEHEEEQVEDAPLWQDLSTWTVALCAMGLFGYLTAPPVAKWIAYLWAVL